MFSRKMGAGEETRESPLNGTQRRKPCPFLKSFLSSKAKPLPAGGRAGKALTLKGRCRSSASGRGGEGQPVPHWEGRNPSSSQQATALAGVEAKASAPWGGAGDSLQPQTPTDKAQTPAAPGTLRKPHLHRPSKQACQTEAGPGEQNPPGPPQVWHHIQATEVYLPPDGSTASCVVQVGRAC